MLSLLDLHDSSYHTQLHAIIVKYCMKAVLHCVIDCNEKKNSKEKKFMKEFDLSRYFGQFSLQAIILITLNSTIGLWSFLYKLHRVGEATRSGTEKRCSHNLQSDPLDSGFKKGRENFPL